VAGWVRCLWKIDIFGGIRRSIEAADPNYQAVAEDRADATLTLLAEVARGYIELRGAQRRIEVAQKNLAIERDLSLLGAGLAPRQDLLRTEAQVRDIQAAIPEFETDERTAAYRIAALIGRPPTEVSAELSQPRPIPQSASEAPVGLPSELLKHCPDVRAAERGSAAANARIGTALVSYANTKVRRNELAAESSADAEATDIANLLYERGVESFLPVLDAERSLYAADDALAQERTRLGHRAHRPL
jgi:outer membrane protein TolC